MLVKQPEENKKGMLLQRRKNYIGGGKTPKK
jgi:hypothetical protein